MKILHLWIEPISKKKKKKTNKLIFKNFQKSCLALSHSLQLHGQSMEFSRTEYWSE